MITTTKQLPVNYAKNLRNTAFNMNKRN